MDPDPRDAELVHHLLRIPEHGGRVLRLVVNMTIDPPRVVNEEQTMKLHVDHDADALYLRLDESKIVESEEVSPNVVLDFDAAGVVVGIEILNLSTRTSPVNLRDF